MPNQTVPVPFIPENAPFSNEQRAYLNGLFAGLFSNQIPSAGEVTAPSPSVPLTILWGSQTGNSETLASKFAKRLKKSGFTPKVTDIGEYPPAELANETNLVIITSTYGDGEPPDNAMAFHEFLMSDEAPKLDCLHYSVLGLGDTSYPDFCQCSIDFDRRLTELGATATVARVDCDVDFDEPYEKWASAIESHFGSATESVPEIEEAPTVLEYTKKNPFLSKIIVNRNLNSETSERMTHHVEFSLEGSGLSYQAGDALGVLPSNSQELVEELFEAVGLDKSGAAGVVNTLDIRTLNKKVLASWAEKAQSDELAAIAGDKEKLKEFIWGREVIDLARDYPIAVASLEELAGILKKLTPRLYSIASSPAAHDGQVHLTVGVVRYDSHGRSRQGVCSTFLAKRTEEAKVFIHHNKAFKLPADPDAPIIMVGPGTGIAPFRGFLHERAATGAKGPNWLFFGNPHQADDFLYQEELEGFVSDGTLERLDTAFSRDQKEKIYVQDRMREQGDLLFEWLEKGAYFYVCGDASRMAKDVEKALTDILRNHGKDSEAYLKTMKAEKRYARDVY